MLDGAGVDLRLIDDGFQPCHQSVAVLTINTADSLDQIQLVQLPAIHTPVFPKADFRDVKNGKVDFLIEKNVQVNDESEREEAQNGYKSSELKKNVLLSESFVWGRYSHEVVQHWDIVAEIVHYFNCSEPV
jgi:hypothetical protein